MSSPLDSTSPGNAPPFAEPPGSRRTAPHRPLQRTLALAVAPLCLLGLLGSIGLSIDARHVHQDLQRMFEEMREVSLTRSLLDELRGLQQWVEAIPEATHATNELAYDDLQHHLTAAKLTFARFTAVDDPSDVAHDAEEQVALRRVHSGLEMIAERLTADAPIETLAAPLQLALHGANTLADTVTQETRSIGDGLDRRSARLVEFLTLLGVAGLATVFWATVWLRRRVLQPLQELHAATAKLAHGLPVQDLHSRHHDEFGELTRAFGAMATQVRQAREDLESRVEARSREVLRTARLAELGTLSAGIAHEINNPLASIATCAEGLLRDLDHGQRPDASREREYLQIIRKEALRTRDITSRLLSLARQNPPTRTELRLALELREVAALFDHQFASARVELLIDVPQRVGTVLGDAAEMRQVIFNLLRNALDASPAGGTVRVTVRDLGDQVTMQFADQGPGFRDEDLDRLFEPFFTTKAPGKGTGLGLAIVHRIVVGQGGSVTACRGASGGAVFTVSLPRASEGDVS